MSTDFIPEQQMTVVRYRAPTLSSLGRGIVSLAKTSVMEAGVHILAPGTPQGLHAHEDYDQFYFVLAGQVRFVGATGAATVLGPHEGVTVPRGTPYGFEAVKEEAQLLFVIARTAGSLDRFIAHAPGSDRVKLEVFAPDGAALGIYRQD